MFRILPSRHTAALVSSQEDSIAKIVTLICAQKYDVFAGRDQRHAPPYLLRIATTGSIFAAIDAGIIPASIPVKMQKITAPRNIPSEIETVK